MNTNVEALQRLYVKMGGNLEDVSDKTTISEMIDAITAISGNAGELTAIDDGNGNVTLAIE